MCAPLARPREAASGRRRACDHVPRGQQPPWPAAPPRCLRRESARASSKPGSGAAWPAGRRAGKVGGGGHRVRSLPWRRSSSAAGSGPGSAIAACPSPPLRLPAPPRCGAGPARGRARSCLAGGGCRDVGGRGGNDQQVRARQQRQPARPHSSLLGRAALRALRLPLLAGRRSLPGLPCPPAACVSGQGAEREPAPQLPRSLPACGSGAETPDPREVLQWHPKSWGCAPPPAAARLGCARVYGGEQRSRSWVWRAGATHRGRSGAGKAVAGSGRTAETWVIRQASGVTTPVAASGGLLVEWE